MTIKHSVVAALLATLGASAVAVEGPLAQPAAMQYEAPSLGRTSPGPGRVAAPAGAPAVAPVVAPLVAAPAVAPGLPRDLFDSVLSTQVPLSPAQIKELHIAEDNIKRAHSARPRVMPSPVSRTVTQSFAPGRSPEIIRLASDFTSTLVFTDSSGAAWPAVRVIVGSKGAVRIPELEDAAGGALKAPTNILTVSPLEDYVSTNVTVLLQGAPAPLTLMLVSGQPSLDMRVDVSVQARGPNAVAPSFEGGVPNVSLPAAFSAFLDGVPPAGSQALKSDNGDVEAWVYGDRMMVRTRLALLSPYVFRRAVSADGTAVFEVAQSSVVLGMSQGRVISVGISGFPPPSIEALRKAVAS